VLVSNVQGIKLQVMYQEHKTKP